MSSGTGYSSCKRCKAAVWWLAHASTGKRAPINVMPTEGTRPGNIVVDLDAGTYRIVPSAPGLYLSHFATCPAAKTFRRSGGGTGTGTEQRKGQGKGARR